MDKIGIFCATAGGTSMLIAKELIKAFNIEEEDVINMEEDFDDIEQFEDYKVLFIGSSTWGQGDVHFSWVDTQLEMEEEQLDLSNKIVAFFGAGDSIKHGEHFCSALGKLHKTFTQLGATPIGYVNKDNYSYQFSLAEKDDKLCGLAIDQHNEKEKTKERIENWVNSLKEEIS